LYCYCVALLLFVLSYVLTVCTVPLPPDVNPIAVDIYIYIYISIYISIIIYEWSPDDLHIRYKVLEANGSSLKQFWIHSSKERGTEVYLSVHPARIVNIKVLGSIRLQLVIKTIFPTYQIRICCWGCLIYRALNAQCTMRHRST